MRIRGFDLSSAQATDPRQNHSLRDEGTVDKKTSRSALLDRLLAAVAKLSQLPLDQQVALTVAVTAAVVVAGRLIIKRRRKPAAA